MLTYESIRDAVSREKASAGLTPLPADFFTSARSYLENKSRLRGKEDMWELDQAKRRLQELAEMRERKIITAALYYVRSGVKAENLTEDEYSFLKSLAEVIGKWQEKKKGMVEGKVEPRTVVAFLQDVPAFVGIDMRNYGPFRPGDVSTLPRENAELLQKKAAAKLVELASQAQPPESNLKA